jgi:hypothetical protein
MARGLPRLEHVHQFCDTCVITKHRRGAFPKQARYHAQELLELVHGDLCGLISPATPGGRRYFLLLVDDATCYMWVVLLTAKNNAADAIRRVQAAAEAQSGCKLRVSRMDNGGEFTTMLMKESSATSPRHTPRSRMASLSGGTRRWWQWRVLC